MSDWLEAVLTNQGWRAWPCIVQEGTSGGCPELWVRQPLKFPSWRVAKVPLNHLHRKPPAEKTRVLIHVAGTNVPNVIM